MKDIFHCGFFYTLNNLRIKFRIVFLIMRYHWIISENISDHQCCWLCKLQSIRGWSSEKQLIISACFSRKTCFLKLSNFPSFGTPHINYLFGFWQVWTYEDPLIRAWASELAFSLVQMLFLYPLWQVHECSKSGSSSGMHRWVEKPFHILTQLGTVKSSHMDSCKKGQLGWTHLQYDLFLGIL